ncbi:MAG: DoxX family protein [Pseudomonadota bacterium]
MSRTTIVSPALAAAASLLLAGPATAHVKWFVDQENPNVPNFEPYSFTDLPVLIWIVVGLGLIGTAIFLDGRLPRFSVPNTRIRHDFMELLRIFTGMSFLLTAYEGALIAPHHVAYGGFGTAMVFLQAIVGIMLIANRFVEHAAILMLGVLAGVFIQFGPVAGFEYINFVGIALFLFFNHAGSDDLRARLKPYSVDMLRIFTGIALIVLGTTEKLTGAMLGQAFIAAYEWNFMPIIGFENFSDRLFVLSAGAMEVVFGVIMVLGVFTRLNTLVVSGFMLASNIVFLLINENEAALMELVGHMPIIATALILMLLGSGQRLSLAHVLGRRPLGYAEPNAAAVPGE